MEQQLGAPRNSEPYTPAGLRCPGAGLEGSGLACSIHEPDSPPLSYFIQVAPRATDQLQSALAVSSGKSQARQGNEPCLPAAQVAESRRGASPLNTAVEGPAERVGKVVTVGAT